ncbi:hypothetical protein CtesDRAFT_PD2797 [Comamonas testosteroni KF-1]|uniref:Uncharacterized protein n=1 Tax=Comamonas testosteroni (strain DSM 14576 / KF-1) TaxID=399795 RepID=B7WWW7_COMTK|nr:hypothetical protein CtesDRAFT_PD2797 [Comamonas testosteroni KF-1]
MVPGQERKFFVSSLSGFSSSPVKHIKTHSLTANED